ALRLPTDYLGSLISLTLVRNQPFAADGKSEPVRLVDHHEVPRTFAHVEGFEYSLRSKEVTAHDDVVVHVPWVLVRVGVVVAGIELGEAEVEAFGELPRPLSAEIGR